MDQFEALADPARRRIIDILASGEHTSGQIADVVGYEFRITRTAVSKHLRVLRDARLVDVRADLQWRWYRIARFGFDQLQQSIDELRYKMSMAVGWDADSNREYDPLAGFPPRPAVPFKGPGRGSRRGRRGRVTEWIPSREPDEGFVPTALYPFEDPSDEHSYDEEDPDEAQPTRIRLDP